MVMPVSVRVLVAGGAADTQNFPNQASAPGAHTYQIL